MRLSNLVAKTENGLANSFNWLGVKAENLRCNLVDKVSTAKLEVRAAQLAALRTQLKTMSPLDRQEIELRASEINMIKDAAAVRRQEMKLRRQIARRIVSGELHYTPFIQERNDVL